ncbi:MAG TPA: glycosyltransferase family 4 protein [Nevskiales bacterium]|nr:glycosyltransferase family 4 protein [Nevskiales bacterium]
MPHKLTLVSAYYPSHRGGIEIVAGELASRLARHHDYQIEWFASDTDPTPQYSAVDSIRCRPQRAWNKTERALGIPFPIWPISALVELSRSIESADCVHVHDFVYPCSQAAIWLAKHHQKPLLVTQHIGCVPYQSRIARWTLASLNRIVGAISLSRANQVVFVSEAVHTYFRQFVSFRRPALYIPNGVDRNVFHPVADAVKCQLRAEYSLSSMRPVFLFVGRFVEKKGLRLLAHLAQTIPDVQWVFAGHGPLDPEAWGLPNIRVLRNVSGKSLAKIYQLADLLVLPSRGEGFPLVVQESMACGTPAIVSSETWYGCPAAKNVLLHEKCDATDSEILWQRRLETLVRAPEMLRKLGVLGAQFAMTYWDWASCVRQYASLAADLIRDRDSRIG